MAEDIVKRMERWATFSTYKEFVRDCSEAAAEIVRLRSALKTARADALEEAANEVERWHWTADSRRISVAIRALKETKHVG